MLLSPTNLDPVAAVRQHILHPPLRLHQLPLLVDDDSGERLAEGYRPAVGRELPGEQFEKGGLAGAVGADKADAVTALNAQGEVADDRALSEGLADIFRLDHRL